MFCRVFLLSTIFLKLRNRTIRLDLYPKRSFPNDTINAPTVQINVDVYFLSPDSVLTCEQKICQ